MKDEIRRAELAGKCISGVFFCHQTMFNKHPENGKCLGCYDNERRANGSPCGKTDHQMCAGYAALFGGKNDIDITTIDVEGHYAEEAFKESAFIDTMNNGWAKPTMALGEALAGGARIHVTRGNPEQDWINQVKEEMGDAGVLLPNNE